MSVAFSRAAVVGVARFVGVTIATAWSGIDAVTPLLERMRGEGAVVIVKLDGGRETRPYTVHIASGPLGEDHLRSDSHTVEDALARAIVSYAVRCWGYTLAKD